MAKKNENKSEQKPVTNIDDLIGLFDDGTILQGTGQVINVESFSSGVPSIDVALGCGGIPCGRIIELYGTESSGKTTTCLQFIKACQQHYFEKKQRKGVAMIIDAEHAFDAEWAKNIGCDIDNLLISQPDSGEQAFDILEKVAKSRLVDLVVIDSVAALVPTCELEGEVSDHNIGAQARLMSKGLRVMKGILNKTLTTAIFINQVREKIGVQFGNPETTPGGRALKFYASLRIEIFKGSPIKDGETVVGFSPNLKVVKNKVASPFTKANYDLCFGKYGRPYGIDAESSLISVAKEIGRAHV